VPGNNFSDSDSLILEVASRGRRFTYTELQQIVEHIVQERFPSTTGRARGVTGLEWEGRILKGSDRITSAERHYLRHVVKGLEWPTSTTLGDYLQSIREVVRDPASGVFTSRYRGKWQVGFIRRTYNLRGPLGAEWVMVEYRPDIGWTTAYQPKEGLEILQDPMRDNLIWHRRPE